MSALHWPVVWVLGAGQCVYWGIVYYAYSVLLVPMAGTFGAPHGQVAGAFSVGLGVSAWLATRVGRYLDCGRGVALLRGGAIAGAALLLAWSYVESLAQLYAVWIGLGACMALVLYETAFALVTRAIDEPGRRLRALASVTVMGGLASTVFLPLVGSGVAELGWRPTLRVLVIAWLLTTLVLMRFVLPAFERVEPATRARSPDVPMRPIARWPVAVLGIPFVVATFASMALTTVVIPRLVAQGHSLAAASWVLAALGVMQLPGRLWLWRSGDIALSPRLLLVGPLAVQAGGLLLLATAYGLAGAFAGVALFGVGAGLHTLARPWIVPWRFGVAAAGQVNGTIARAQGIARAAGPFAAAVVADRIGSAAVFAALALMLLACLPLAWSTGDAAVSTEHPTR